MTSEALRMDPISLSVYSWQTFSALSKASKARAYPMGAPVIALPPIIRLGWKSLPGTNTPAY
jgi:hypothetical protein